ncbi:MAG: MbnP family protein [Chitinophagales bacterium]|nr:hypothetical protein [Chitinophagales bacterium]
MKKIIKIAFVLAFFATTLSSCKKDEEGTIKINYKATVNDQELSFYQPYIINGDTITFELFKFYTSDIKIYDKDDNSAISLGDVHLVNYDDADSKTQSITVDATAYKNPTFMIGLSDERNMTDPSSYTSDSPLSLQQGNYWLMASSYIYFKIEGFRKVNGVNEPMVYHVGFNGMGVEKTAQKALSVFDEGTTNINFTVDFDDMFANIDFDTESTTHTTDNMPLAQKMMDNFVNATTIE